jgi:hypothetical protein
MTTRVSICLSFACKKLGLPFPIAFFDMHVLYICMLEHVLSVSLIRTLSFHCSLRTWFTCVLPSRPSHRGTLGYPCSLCASRSKFDWFMLTRMDEFDIFMLTTVRLIWFSHL